MDVNLIKIFMEGPDVSLNGSPTVSPITVALCGSEPFRCWTPLCTRLSQTIFWHYPRCSMHPVHPEITTAPEVRFWLIARLNQKEAFLKILKMWHVIPALLESPLSGYLIKIADKPVMTCNLLISNKFDFCYSNRNDSIGSSLEALCAG